MLIVNGIKSEGKDIIYDNGFSYGQGVFETILIKENPLFLKEHCKRLNDGLEKLNIKKSIDEEYIKKEIKKYEINNCILKIIATEKNIVLITREMTYKEEDYNNGFRVKISDIRRNQYSHVTYIKSLNYTDNYIERQKASEEGYNEVLFFNNNNIITEGSFSNMFFVIGDNIYTPKISCGLLPGIIRDWVIKNFNVIEGEFKEDILLEADEIILTNSVMGIMRVKYIKGYKSYNKVIVCNMIRDKYNCS